MTTSRAPSWSDKARRSDSTRRCCISPVITATNHGPWQCTEEMRKGAFSAPSGISERPSLPAAALPIWPISMLRPMPGAPAKPPTGAARKT